MSEGQPRFTVDREFLLELEGEEGGLEHDPAGYRKITQMYTQATMVVRDREGLDTGTRYLLNRARVDFLRGLDVLLNVDLHSEQGLAEARAAQSRCTMYREWVAWLEEALERANELGEVLRDEEEPDDDLPIAGDDLGHEPHE